MTMNYHGQRTTIMGLGHFGGGAAAARWLAQQGAIVTVSDQADETALADVLPSLADVPIAAWRLGGHRKEDFSDADLIVVNPAVRPNSPWLDVARKTGARLCTELELFLEHCPAHVIGVTGSNGKSTTAAMIASILRADGRRVFLGGNIGGSLLSELPEMRPDDWVVLEISSFQLWHFSPEVKMPHIAVVTNCSPNHLDWHADFADYAAAKQRMLTGQTDSDFAVLNTFDAEVTRWKSCVRGQLAGMPSFDHLPVLPIPGRHNEINAACASAAAVAAGCRESSLRQGLEQFHPLPQRLELVATIAGRRFYNDSTATTPESTIAALQSLTTPVWLLVGGKSKGFDFGPLTAAIANHAGGAAAFGLAREELFSQIAAKNRNLPSVAVETMDEALAWCWSQSKPGDAIILSPACASTDQFRNFRHRGERFTELVLQLSSCETEAAKGPSFPKTRSAIAARS
jgi:UDP-N-acetylmuramoylalanine--D-glutamate ligase